MNSSTKHSVIGSVVSSSQMRPTPFSSRGSSKSNSFLGILRKSKIRKAKSEGWQKPENEIKRLPARCVVCYVPLAGYVLSRNSQERCGCAGAGREASRGNIRPCGAGHNGVAEKPDRF